MPGGRVDAACIAIRRSVFSCIGGCDFAPLAASITPSAVGFLRSFIYMPLNAEGPSSISSLMARLSTPSLLLVRLCMTDGSSPVK